MRSSHPSTAPRALTLVAALVLALLVPLSEVGAQPAGEVLTVDSTGDASDAAPGNHGCDTHPADNGAEPPECTLRAALQEANALPGTQTIVFALDGDGPHVITPATSLPEVTDPVVIDASDPTQGPSDPRRVELDGSAVDEHEENGLLIRAGGSTIRGLAIHSFAGSGDSNGIMLVGGDGNTVAGNWFGLRADGTAGGRLGDDGIEVTWAGGDPSDGNVIGGADPVDRNVIGRADDDGIDLSTSANTVRGNHIGVAPDGSTPLGNEATGVVVDEENDVPHGPSANDIVDNVIAANGDDGIQIDGGDGNRVRRNLIGVTADGSTPRGNGDEGIEVAGSGNLIGAAAEDDAATAEEGNVVAHNAEVGIEVERGTGNRILGNKVHDNGGLGIDLDIDGGGVTPNDAGDGDVGPNDLQNHPVIDVATPGRLAGTLDSVPGATYTVELFANASCDPSGHGEAERLLSRTTVAVGATGGSFEVDLADGGVSPGEHVTATATTADGSTSELSTCTSVGDVDPPQELCDDAPPAPFADVRPDSTHGPAIACLASLAITVGLTPDTYGPTRDISRGQVASLVARSLQRTGVSLPGGGDAFTDDDGSTHEQAIDGLAAAGILDGFDDGTVRPTAAITRAQVATVVARAADAAGLDLPAGADAFTDDDGSVHELHIDRLAAAGIVQGVGGRRYLPTVPITRAETASVLVRWLAAIPAP